jgi:putative ABC transport system permease protein
MILLRLISWPYLRRHLLRTALTTTGIVLGVAVLVAMHAANESVLFGFAQTVDRIAGKTELQVSAGEAGFNEDVLDKVQSASTVRVAVPVIEAVVESAIAGQGSLLVLGVDMTGDRSLREYDLDSGDDLVLQDPLIFLAQPDSLIISKEFASRNRMIVGARLPLASAEGTRTFTVRGIMKSSGLASAFGGNLVIMDIFAAQKMFGRGRTFDRIDLAVKPGVSLADCQRELAALLGPAFEVRPPSGRSQQFETMLAGYSLMVDLSSAFALMIGMFIIYNSFSIAVAQRRFEIGMLKALGATTRQIERLFLTEGALLGLAGSVGGSIVGLVVARAMSTSLGALIASVYGVADKVGEVAANPVLLGGAATLGIATSLLAATLPARQAARLDPVQALQRGSHQFLSSKESRVRLTVSAILGAFSVACVASAHWGPVFYAGYVAVIVVAVLLAPGASLALIRLIRPCLRWLRPVEGALAADSLIQAPRRTSVSVAALMLSLALVVAFAGMARASRSSIVDWMNSALDPDLFVLPTQSLDVQAIRFPAGMGPELRSIAGVQRVQLIRNSRVTFRQSPVQVAAFETDNIAQTARLPPVEGRPDEMYRKTAAGEGLIVSDNLAQLERLALGDVLEIPAPYGVIRLPIVGVISDYSDQRGSIFIDRQIFIRYWHDDSVNAFRVYVAPGHNVPDVRQRILDRYAGRRQLFVMTNTELKSYILKVAGQWFSLSTLQIAVAVIVAILGIANTLTVSIHDRRREMGVLRAVGGTAAQIRRTIWMEALGIGAVGVVLGSAFGAVNLYYVLEIVRHDIAGMRFAYEFPVSTSLALVPIILGSAFVAALWPAESAVRGSLVEALEYE